MINAVFGLVVLTVFGLIVLQIFLSKRSSRWPGLILPIIAALLGLLYPLNVMVPPDGMSGGIVLQLILIWALGNIPTAVFLVIYFICKGKPRQRQIDE